MSTEKERLQEKLQNLLDRIDFHRRLFKYLRTDADKLSVQKIIDQLLDAYHEIQRKIDSYE